VAAIAALAMWLFIRPDRYDGGPPSVAVLPLENLSADPEQEYFSGGITDALITDLAKLRSLRVISRTSGSNSNRPGKRFPKSRASWA